MQKPRKIPQRMCVGCREKRDKKDLLRVVSTPEGQRMLEVSIPDEVYEALERQMETEA